MKLVQHPNVVRLYEVIDTATKLYLILELGDGGDMYDCIMKHDGGLSEEVSGLCKLSGAGDGGCRGIHDRSPREALLQLQLTLNLLGEIVEGAEENLLY